MFNGFADDYTLKILIGERLAEAVWHAALLYYAIIAGYVFWKIWLHHKGEPWCHHHNCQHLTRKAKAHQKEIARRAI